MERTIITSLTPDEFRQIVVESVQHCLKTYKPIQDSGPRQVDTPYVSKKEAAQIMSVCTSSIDNAARAGKIKRHYVGKKVLFDRVEVLALAKTDTGPQRK
jgi:hypothetical protein